MTTGLDPYLDRGEEVQHVARALEGPNRWIGLLIGSLVGFPLGVFVGPPAFTPLYMFVVWTRIYDRRLIVFTNRHVRLFKATFFGFKPKRELLTLPRSTRVGPLKGVWMQTRIEGRRIAVVPRFAKIVDTADGEAETGNFRAAAPRPAAPTVDRDRPVPPSAYRGKKRLRK